jgi:hypothetical protein
MILNEKDKLEFDDEDMTFWFGPYVRKHAPNTKF